MPRDGVEDFFCAFCAFRGERLFVITDAAWQQRMNAA
jgi:hypothetical protein